MTNYKSLFILHVYFYCIWDPKPKYDIDKEELECVLSRNPGFHIEKMETGFYQSLAGAEKRIRQLAKNKSHKVYCSFVEEKPLDYSLYPEARLSRRCYLGNGKLWQISEVSNICNRGKKIDPLGDVVFHGRNPKTILFEEGDIVEVVQEDFVQLAIVWKMPATVEQVEKYRLQRQQRKRYDPVVPCLGNLHDSYTLVGYTASKSGEVCGYNFDKPVVDVLPASMSVPRKIAAELRKQLKIEQETKEDDLPF